MDINRYPIYGGRMVAEDGSVVNIADAIGGENTGMKADINRYPVYGGRFVAEDGSVLNIAKNIGKGSGGKTDSDDILTVVAAVSSGNVNTYRATMRQWFRERLPDGWTAADLTALCDKWYTITRTGWAGGAEFYGWSISQVSTGTRIGDAKGLTCTPSTDTVKNKDDFEGLPLFAIKDCNWIVDADTLEPVITAIDGITDNFVRDDPGVYVGVLQMAPWHYWVDDDNDAHNFIHGVTDAYAATYANIAPVPESVRQDGTMRPWVLHSKYMSKTVNGKMTSCAGLIPSCNTSHNNLHTLSVKNGTQYSGGTIVDLSWLILMTYVKYASMTLDGILQGCCNYNYQYPVAAGETGVKRVLLTTAQAANLMIGSSVLLGNYNGNKDRGNGDMQKITTSAGAKIASIGPVNVSGTDYAAVSLEIDNAFDTVANGADTVGTTYLSTFHWPSGSCDGVLGNDGSPTDCKSGKYPARLQGIEYMVGGYEVLADTILRLYKSSDGAYATRPAIVSKSAQQAASVTSDYKEPVNLLFNQPTDSAGWKYISHMYFANGAFFPRRHRASSSTGTCDGLYTEKSAVGTREYLAFGGLHVGSGSAGLSCLHANGGLGGGNWYSLARLSPTGNRGEFSA